MGKEIARCGAPVTCKEKENGQEKRVIPVKHTRNIDNIP
jgi:hypothetical protein